MLHCNNNFHFRDYVITTIKIKLTINVYVCTKPDRKNSLIWRRYFEWLYSNEAHFLIGTWLIPSKPDNKQEFCTDFLVGLRQSKGNVTSIYTSRKRNSENITVHGTTNADRRTKKSRSVFYFCNSERSLLKLPHDF